MDWFQIGEEVCQGCILSPCFFNLYTDYVMQNARLDEAQAGIKIARRNESERGEWKVGLKFNIQKTKIMASGPIISWHTDGETVETVWQALFSWAPKSLQMVTAAMNLKDAYSLEEKLWPS